MNLGKGVSDQLLVRQALSGQRESFDLLVAKYLRMVHAVAYAQTRSHTDAEDVTQETFVKAFMSLHTLRDATRIGAWLGSIAWRTCHQLMAKTQGRRELEQRAGTCDAVPPADVIVEDEETAELVRGQLDALEPDEREILMLRYFAGHSVDEVASILEIRPNTVKRHGSLALRVDSPSDGRASFADLPTDQSAPFDLRMPAMTAVSGKILWEDDAPTTGCVVKLQAPLVQFSETVSPDGMRFGGGGAVGGTSAGLAQATVAADGTYRIEGVEPGENFVSIADSDGTIIARDLELGMLNPGQEHLWNYRVTKPRLVRGLVRGGNSGTPLPGIVVMCENVEARSGLALPPLTATTGADGRYELRVFSSPGTYEVTPLYNRNGSMFRPTPEEAFAALVSMRTGGTDQTVDLAIPEPCTRSFRVIDAEGQPVAGCATEVHERLDRGRHYWLWPDRTDANGRVVLSGLPPDAGIEFLFRSPQGCGMSALYHGEAGERVPEETVVVYLPAGVSGALFDRDGSALANTEFELAVFWDSKLETRVSGVTDAVGRFQLADAAPATIAVCEFSVTMKNASNPQRLTYTSGPIEFIPNDWTDLGALVLKATGDALGR